MLYFRIFSELGIFFVGFLGVIELYMMDSFAFPIWFYGLEENYLNWINFKLAGHIFVRSTESDGWGKWPILSCMWWTLSLFLCDFMVWMNKFYISWSNFHEVNWVRWIREMAHFELYMINSFAFPISFKVQKGITLTENILH